MNDALNEALKEAYALAPSDEVTIETLQLSHPSVGGVLYMVRQMSEMTLGLEDGTYQTFEPVGFTFSLPEAGENGRQDMQISIDNVDRRVSDFIEKCIQFPIPVQVTYRPYLSSDLSMPQMNPPLTLTLHDVSVTVMGITGRATFADVLNEKFPQEYYTRLRFPSLGA